MKRYLMTSPEDRRRLRAYSRETSLLSVGVPKTLISDGGRKTRNIKHKNGMYWVRLKAEPNIMKFILQYLPTKKGGIPHDLSAIMWILDEEENRGEN